MLWKGYISSLVAVIILVIIAIIYYGKKSNPEIKFWSQAVDAKISALTNIPVETSRIFFIGGSSCSFSINPKICERELNSRVVNFGLQAAAGVKTQTEFALQYLKPGDSLVLAYESDIWLREVPMAPTQFSSQFVILRPDVFKRPPRINKIGLKDDWSVTDLRPGGLHVSSMIGKKIFGKPAYRYQSSDIQIGGYLTCTDYGFEPTPRGKTGNRDLEVNLEMLNLAKNLKLYCDKHDIRLLLTFPWVFCETGALAEIQKQNQSTARKLSDYAILLPDPNWGAHDSRKQFSDTIWHLSRKGADKRSQIINMSLRKMGL